MWSFTATLSFSAIQTYDEYTPANNTTTLTATSDTLSAQTNAE